VVNRITFHAEPVAHTGAPIAKCEVDSLATKPFGISLRDAFIFEVRATRHSGRYIDSEKPGAARNVSPDDILRVGKEEKGEITLKPDTKDTRRAFNVTVSLPDKGRYRVWFSAVTAARGSRRRGHSL